MKKGGDVVDVAVVGGGPAGAAAALALAAHAPSRRVAVIDASTYDAPRIGETLHPAARSLLARLGVWDAFLGLGAREAPGTVSAWGSPALGGEDFFASTRGPGYHLDRRRFDAMLAREAAARGAELILGRKVTAAARAGSAFALTLSGPPGVETIKAAFVIDASGRRARAASALGAARYTFDREVAAFVFFDAKGAAADDRTLVEAVEHGFWYSAPLPGAGAVAALLTDGDLAARLGLADEAGWRAALAAAEHTRARLAGAVPLGAPSLHPADSSALDEPAGEGWVAAGDAALTLDPLSGQGLVKALQHGLLAAYAADDHLSGRPSVAARYRAHLAGEIEGYLEARERCYRAEARFAGAPFWARRRPRLSLAPEARLVARDPALSARLSMHLPSADLGRLTALAGAGRRAHEVIRAAPRAGVTASPRRLILALQYLIERGALGLAAEAERASMS